MLLQSKTFLTVALASATLAIGSLGFPGEASADRRGGSGVSRMSSPVRSIHPQPVGRQGKGQRNDRFGGGYTPGGGGAGSASDLGSGQRWHGSYGFTKVCHYVRKRSGRLVQVCPYE